MKNINEDQVLSNIRLSQTQKFILTKLVIPNSTTLTSYENISSGKNIVANRDVLVKLGMVEVGQNEAQITDKGTEALKNENLVDDMGNLTEEGEQYAYASDLKDIEKLASQQNNEPEKPSTELPNQPDDPNAQQPTEIANQPESGTVAPSFESWSMILDMQTELSEKQFKENCFKKS